MSTVSFSSLSAPTMRSAVLIWPTRISTLAKSSMPIFSAVQERLPRRRLFAAAAARWRWRWRAGCSGDGAFLCFVFHGFDPLHCFCFFDAWEKWLRLAECGAGSELSPAQAVEFLRAEAAGAGRAASRLLRCYPAARDAPAR